MNDQQLAVYNYNDCKSLLVVAGAGSGKTTTIVNKIVKMIKNGCNSNQFMITTFTRNAGIELKKRLLLHLHYEQLDEMLIGTFHSIAYKQLKKYNKLNGNIVQSFDRLLFDFLQFIKTSFFQNNNFIKYLYVDEFQDIDDTQYQIIYQMFLYNCTIVAIGDDQQNIYTFRNSNIKYILEFTQNFNSEMLKLETNYRCFQSIVTVSNYLLEYNNDKIEKTFVSYKKDNKKIILNLLPKNQHTYDKIFKLIMQMKQNNINFSDIAVISRTKLILLEMEDILSKHKIPPSYLETHYDQQHNEIQEKRLVLTTIHGTKGLEFKHVIFVDFNPSNKVEYVQEERRLYYVAITRSIESLNIIINQKEKPSIFLTNIFEKCFNNNDLFENFDINFDLTNNIADIDKNSNKVIYFVIKF